MHEIDIYRSKRNICCNCVDELCMGGNPEKLKKVGHITVYRIEELEEDFERMAHTLWSLMMQSNVLEGFPSVTC